MKNVMPFPRHTSRQRAPLSISVAVGQTPAYAVRQPIYRASNVSRGLPVCVTAFDSTNLYHLVTQIRGREKKLMPESAVARSQIHDDRVVNRTPRPTDH